MHGPGSSPMWAVSREVQRGLSGGFLYLNQTVCHRMYINVKEKNYNSSLTWMRTDRTKSNGIMLWSQLSSMCSAWRISERDFWPNVAIGGQNIVWRWTWRCPYKTQERCANFQSGEAPNTRGLVKSSNEMLLTQGSVRTIPNQTK